ncbi:MAG: hypothetical protein M0004_03655 [Actinomycetota bacterium]|nr:hypothetical protein [Actinomycetota bacterium]
MSAAYETIPPSQATITEPVVPAPSRRIGGTGVGLIGLLTVFVSAWGGIVPFVGPIFGYRADGTAAWHWDLAHGILAVAPGAIGVVIGVLMMATARRVRFGEGRLSLSFAGLVALACGAWFVIGPLAWSTFEPTHYFVAASPLHRLANEVGYALGPGVLLALLGGEAIGWALRHRQVRFVAPAAARHRAGRHLAPVASEADVVS